MPEVPPAESAAPPVDPNRHLRKLGHGDLVAERFTLDRVIGKGTFAVVWEAHDEKLGRTCALKLLSAAFTGDTVLAELWDGIERAKTLEHPHIVRTFELVEDQERELLAVAMEFFPSQSIEKLRAEKPHGWFEPEEIAEWMQQCCNALADAHNECGIAHRNLKPTNLLVDAGGTVKITDFGIPPLVEAMPLHFTGRETSGTAAYLSPQQMRGEPADLADDLYALGVTLYELLAGKPPFLSANLSYQLFQVTTQTAPSITERRRASVSEARAIPAEWEETISALLSREAAQRPSAREVARRLAPSADHATAPVAKPEPPPAISPTEKAAEGSPASVPREEVAAVPNEPVVALPARVEAKAPSPASVAPLDGEGSMEMSWRWIAFLGVAILAVVGIGVWLGRDTRPHRAPSEEPAAPTPSPVPAVVATPAPTPSPQPTPAPAPSPTPGPTPMPATPAPATPATPAPAPATPAPAPVKSLPPFANSLQMRFIPLPGADVRMCLWPTRVRDYAAYAKASELRATSWSRPGFEQGPDQPVVNVSWDDAVAFCDWLTRTEREQGIISKQQRYRLPTDREWSLGVGLSDEAGATPAERDLSVPDVYPWGKQWPPPSGAGNYAGSETDSETSIKDYNDGFPETSPVGSFPANPLGFYDMGGNVWQWVDDSWSPQSKDKVARGASWYNGTVRISLLSSCRVHTPPQDSRDNYGFRVVLEGEGEKSPRTKAGK